MRFVQISIEDAPRVAQLIAAAFAVPPWCEEWEAARALAYAREGLDGANALAFALAEGETLCALAMGHVRHWHDRTELILEDVCVHPERQGHGLGGQMLEETAAAAKRLAIDEIGLRTRRDAAAYRFYQKHGFAVLEKDVYLSRKL